jgi:predicted site-specific integrase-resolvase
MSTTDRWLYRDVAAALGAEPATVRQWLRRGKLPPPSGRVGQSPWWAPDVIEPWIRNREKEQGR